MLNRVTVNGISLQAGICLTWFLSYRRNQKLGGNCRKCSIFVRTISSAQFDSVSAMKISFDETIRYRLGLNSRQSFSLFKSLEFRISTGICMQIRAGDREAEELICKSMEREVW